MAYKVAVLMGSPNDGEKMAPVAETLERYGVEADVRVMSAHRSPALVAGFVTGARDAGYSAIICGAGMAAHLAGAAAAHTTLPVIGIPVPSSDLKGVDSLYAIAQMPPGIPVACMAVGAWGARNAAFFAAEILGLKYDAIRQAYEKYRQGLREQ